MMAVLPNWEGAGAGSCHNWTGYGEECCPCARRAPERASTIRPQHRSR